MNINKEFMKKELDEYFMSRNTDKIYVLGEGNENSEIVFIGEAPGADEEKALRPFVGKAGKNLNYFLENAGCSREDIYITNAVKFRPTQIGKTGRLSNRTPTTEEIVEYREWLLKELSIIDPKLVITLGNTPLFSLTNDKKLKITAVHGTLINYENTEYNLKFKLMPFYHPAAVIYKRELVSEYEKDMSIFAEISSKLTNVK